ncbi:hypothetical protein BDZ89DRAFT_1069813, partial [Hymenopellis radicata]
TRALPSRALAAAFSAPLPLLPTRTTLLPLHMLAVVTAATFATLRLSLLSCMAMHFATFSCIPVYLCGRDTQRYATAMFSRHGTATCSHPVYSVAGTQCYATAMFSRHGTATCSHPVYSVAGT